MNKVKRINIFLLILSIIIIFVSMFSSGNIEVLMLGLSCVINVYIFIVSLVSIKKSSITMLIISLLLTLFFGFGTISVIISNAKRNNYLNSEEFYIEQAKDLERSLSNSAKYYYDLEYYVENLNIGKITITKLQAEDKFDEKWFELKEDELGTCDGYIVINVNQDNIENIIENYKERINTDSYTPGRIVSYDYDGIRESLNINAFISCNGNYSYTTDGFNNNEEVFSITIPKSYFDFTNTQIDENVNTLKNLGNEYITSVKTENSTIIIEMTESQKNKLIERNNKYIETLLNDFSNANEKYRYEFNSDFSELTYYFDENISAITQGKLVSIIAGYILNNILKTNNQDWKVHLKIINCHTNKVVAEGNLPKDTIKYGETEWNNSY